MQRKTVKFVFVILFFQMQQKNEQPNIFRNVSYVTQYLNWEVMQVCHILTVQEVREKELFLY